MLKNFFETRFFLSPKGKNSNLTQKPNLSAIRDTLRECVSKSPTPRKSVQKTPKIALSKPREEDAEGSESLRVEEIKAGFGPTTSNLRQNSRTLHSAKLTTTTTKLPTVCGERALARINSRIICKLFFLLCAKFWHVW